MIIGLKERVAYADHAAILGFEKDDIYLKRRRKANIVLKTHDFDEANFIAHRIEVNIKQKIKNVDRVLIHFEPTQKEILVYAIPLKDANHNQISPHFGEAPYFVLVKVRAKERPLKKP